MSRSFKKSTIKVHNKQSTIRIDQNGSIIYIKESTINVDLSVENKKSTVKVNIRSRHAIQSRQ